MLVRKLKEDDIKKCLDIYNYYVENTCITLEEDKVSYNDFYMRCLTICHNYPFIVLEDDDLNIIGYAYLSTFNPRSAYRITVDLFIYTSKDYLHKGAGKLLLHEIEKYAHEQGIKNIISIVTSENSNSLAFHLKNGFKLEGKVNDVAIKFGKLIGVNYLRKAI